MDSALFVVICVVYAICFVVAASFVYMNLSSLGGSLIDDIGDIFISFIAGLVGPIIVVLLILSLVKDRFLWYLDKRAQEKLRKEADESGFWPKFK
ncbi:MAG TPA: hypothetical protein VHC21_02565 [Candidatus Saccharimonadales bacterium]|nr:hypothetical protein [Candidatus Saccharimonadales bacterium]